MSYEFIQQYNDSKKAGYFDDNTYSDLSVFKQLNSKKHASFAEMKDHKQLKVWGQIKPTDVVQGCLQDCVLLTYLMALAINPVNIKQLFVFWDQKVGYYVLKFWTPEFTVRYISINAIFPVKKTENQTYLFAYPHNKKIWVSLVQKAFTKFIGGLSILANFQKFQKQLFHDYVHALQPMYIEFYKIFTDASIFDETIANGGICFFGTKDSATQLVDSHLYYVQKKNKNKYHVKTCRQKSGKDVTIKKLQKQVQLIEIICMGLKYKSMILTLQKSCMVSIQSFKNDSMVHFQLFGILEDNVLFQVFQKSQQAIKYNGVKDHNFCVIPNIVIQQRGVYRFKLSTNALNAKIKIIYSIQTKILDVK